MKHQIGNQTKRNGPITDNSDLIKLANSYKAPVIQSKTIEAKTTEPTKIILPSELTASDYIVLNNQTFSIGLNEKGKNIYNQAKSTLEKGLQFQDLREGMQMYRGIIDAHLNGTTLYHPNQNPVSEKDIKNLYKELTQNNWQNLNAFFEKTDSGILMKKATELKNEEIIYSDGIVIPNLESSILYDLSNLNSEGFPKNKSSSQSFDKDKNIRFWIPFDGRVARLSSDSVLDLDCNSNPDNNFKSIGVRYSIAHGQKE